MPAPLSEEHPGDSERLLRESQRVACIGSYDFDVRADRWAGSETMEALFGIGPDYPRTVSGWLALIHPDDQERLRRHLVEDVLGQRRSFDCEYRILPADGGPLRWVHGLGQLIFDQSGEPVRMLGTIQDITVRKRIEQLLADREGTYQAVFNATNDALFIHGPDGRILDVNERTCVLFGYDHAGIMTRGVDDLSLGHPPYSSAESQEWIRRAVSGGPQTFSWRSRRRDGSLFWSEVSLRACTIAGEQRVIASVRDITDRMQAEEAVRRNERRLSMAFSATSDAIWEWDLATGETYYSPRWYAMLGYENNAFPMTFDVWKTLCHPEDIQPAIDRIQAVLESPDGQGYVAEFRMRHRDGTWRWIQGRGNVVARAPDGKPVMMSGTNTDVSERRRLTEDRDRLFNLSLDMLCIAGFDGYFRQINPAWTTSLGWSQSELLRSPWITFVHPDDREATEAAGRRLLAGTPVSGFENRYRCKDGSFRTLAWNSFSLVEEQRIFAVVRDLTEVRRTDERLHHADKMNAIGQLAGGVAHDFNNQLGAIMGYAEMLLRRVDDPDQRRYTERIITAVRRSSDLTGKLLAFARKGQYLNVPVDVHVIIAETVDILSRSVDRRIRIEQILTARSAVVSGDPSQLQNALLNLGLNARDAMPEGGLLRYVTDEVQLSREDLVRLGFEQGGCSAGSYLSLQVADTGCGMDESVQAHLFEPFFTTKDPGRGTGMGLAAVYGTVRNHHGAISVHSEAGHGTVFHLLLPLSETPRRPSSGESRMMAAIRRLRVLVVDDEPTMREILAELLREDGHEVVIAADGRAAVELYRQQHGSLDLVILDMVMPGMNGRDSFRAMREINPRIRALLASGYSIDGEAQTILQDGVRGFIQKPFNHRDLVRSITEAMAERPSA